MISSDRAEYIRDRIFDSGYGAIAVAGPTASGKTALSVELARRLGGEIISCDSMQIYRGMDIATAKVTAEEMCGIPHHLIDVLEPSCPYSAADYVTDAERTAREIRERGRLPIFCGGTGLYLDSVMRGEYPEVSESDPALRAELAEYAREHGNTALHGMLRELDPESAEAIHENNVKRVIRAIEIAKGSGKKKSELDLTRQEYKGMKIFVVYLTYSDRELLYRRIEQRVDMMLDAGVCDELRSLMEDGGFMSNATAMQAIGYKELIPYIRGESSLCECADVLKRATRRYAKRQLTWFSGRGYARPLLCDGHGAQRSTAELADEYIRMLEEELSL